MTEMPERIAAWEGWSNASFHEPRQGGAWQSPIHPNIGGTPYLRADVAAAQSARIAELEAALREVAHEIETNTAYVQFMMNRARKCVAAALGSQP